VPVVTTLLDVVARGGATLTTRHERPIAAHYGSAGGELAVCVCNVGLIARTDLDVLVLTGKPAMIEGASLRLAGWRIATGGALPGPDAWWCRTSSRELVLVARPSSAARVRRILDAERARTGGAVMARGSEKLIAIGVVGRRAAAVLADLGAYGPAGDPRAGCPVTAARLGEASTLWLHQSDAHAIALVPSAAAVAAWERIEAAGRPYGLSHIGIEALERYAVLHPSPSSI
jgi:hypothetical protein